jgi:hypothetical protein
MRCRSDSFVAILLAAALVAVGAGAADPPPSPPPPIVFEGFGLGDMTAAASAARALRVTAACTHADPDVPLDVMVRGPGGGRMEPVPAPLAAEVRSRIEGFDVAAGFQGDARALADRTPRWTGRIGMGSTGPAGGESLELRTRLESRAGVERLGVEIGPRIERRLRRGARVFLDGAASAEAVRSGVAEGWQFPGTPAADSAAAVGITARTGIIR